MKFKVSQSKGLKLFAALLVFMGQFTTLSPLILQVNAAVPVVYITSSSNNSLYQSSSVVVDPNLTINFNSENSITGAKAVITTGFISGDTLSGTNASYNSSTGVLTFSGTYASAADLQAALRSVTFTPASSNTDINSRTIVFTVGTGLYYEGHYYQSVFKSSGISWSSSLSEAESLLLFGLHGYLATIQSAGENAFILQKLSSSAWIGASDDYAYINDRVGTSYANQSASEGKWYWISGPTAERVQFSNGNVYPSTLTNTYANWNGLEPNNSGSSEHYAEFYAGAGTSEGKWNDLSNGNLNYYLVEYGGMSNDPVVTLNASKTVEIDANTLTYDANEATSGTAPSVVNYRVSAGTQSITVSNQNTLAKTNYTFIGWNTEADGTGTKYDANSTLALSSDVTLYAQWLRISSSNPSINFTIDGNNASIDPNFILDGTALSSVAISISNYVPGDVLHFTDTSDITGSYNNGTLVLSSSSAKSASLFQAAVRLVTLSSTQSPGTRTINYSVVLDTTETDTIKYNVENQHFYQLIDLGPTSANWLTWTEAKADAATRSYNGKTGYLATLTSLSEDNKIKQIASAFVGSSTSMWMGFKNIESAQTDNGTSYWDGDWQWADGPEAGTSFFTGYNLTTACSTAVGTVVNNQYTRWGYHEPNGCGNSGRGYGTYWMGASYDLNNNGTIDAGETAVGAWDDNSSTNATDSELRYYFIEYGGLSSDDYTTQSSITVLPHTYTLAYDGNSASSGSAPSNSSGSVTYAIASNSGNLVRSGYDFDGWNTLASGLGTTYSVGSSITPSGDVTLYAKWVAITISNELSIAQTAKSTNSSTVNFAHLNSSYTSLSYAAVPHGMTAPSTAEIINGQYASGGSFKASGTISTSGTSTSTTLSNLQDYFYYDLYAVQVDSNNNARNANAIGQVIYSSLIRVAYDFNNNVSDQTGQKEDLVATNPYANTANVGYTSVSEGMIQNAYRFDGTRVFTLPYDIIQYGGTVRTPFTVSFYFKTSSTQGVGLLGYATQDVYYSGAVNGFIPILTIATDGKLHAVIWKGTGDLHVVSNYAVNDGEWHKVILSAYPTPGSPTTDTLDVYVDGVQIATDSNGTMSHFNMANVSLGTSYAAQRFDGGTYDYDASTNIVNHWFKPYEGYIDELMIMSGGMSQSQIQEASNDIALEYELNGGTNPSGTLYLYSKTALSAYALPTPSKTNYSFGGWYTTSDFTSSAVTQVEVGTSSNQKYYAKWIINTKMVSFDANGGTSVESIEVNLGSPVSKPSNPTRTGYYFGGWYSDSTLSASYSFSSNVTSDITLYAKWNISQYTIAFDAQGGSLVNPQSVSYNHNALVPTQPTRSGYAFAGWYTESATTHAFAFTTAITQNMTLYAKWTRNSYTVVFNSNGGSNVDSVQVLYLNQVVKPDDPSLTGKVFKGWYTSSALTSPYDFDSAQITTNTTLYAKWVDLYTFDFDSNFGSYVQGQNIENGSSATQPPNPTRTGYGFIGWKTNPDLLTAYDFNDPVTTSTTVYAAWNRLSYPLSFDSKGGSSTPIDQNVLYGDLASTVLDPSKDNMTFIGWSTSEFSYAAFDFSLNRIYSATTLYAIYLGNSYTYTFKDSSGQTLSTNEINFGDAIPTPPRQYKEGYRFIGWEESFNANTQSFEMTPSFTPIPVDIQSNTIAPTLANVFDAVEFSDEELESEVSVSMDFNVLTPTEVDADDKTLFDAKALDSLPSGTISSLYIDISLFKVVNSVSTQLTTVLSPITIEFEVPLEYRNRFFELIRIHDGSATIIDYIYHSSTHTISFVADQFSTYGLTLSSASGYRPTETNNASPTYTVVESVQTPVVVKKTLTVKPNDSSNTIVPEEKPETSTDADGSKDVPQALDNPSLTGQKNLFSFFGDIWTSTKESIGLWLDDFQYVVLGIKKEDDPAQTALKLIFLFMASLAAVGAFIYYLFKRKKDKKVK